MVQKSFEIKNNSRLPAVFYIDDTKLPEGVELNQLKGKIGPDDVKTIILKFFLKRECSVNSEIVILIRGGRTLRLPFSATTIIPDI